ncbi:MAG: ABC transporter ATP-binding protein [Rhodospirillales bacterium]|nr:ABC transporter ATP-binding protein [Rhodospirillales bacterium]MBT4085468.1 ABC transporter ATP-binding protein [Alphaproteobacteria bacterium]MBT6240446.1 ABC transporter ATP-binding protein [Rhodospirillaceae bacterium]
MLSVKNASVYFGKVSGIKDVSIDVEEGQIVALIGANGAGKSTTLRAISGLKQPSKGEIWFKGERIDHLSPEEITMRGIAHVPEGRRVFPFMTVKENLEMGAFTRKDKGGIARDLESVFKHFPRLRERLTQAAGTMSGGEQQMLAMGRALMSDPKVVLMDEPSLGLSPILCQEIAKIIKEIHAEGRTVVLVEQNARLALSLAQKGYVLETGSVVLEDDAKALLENDKVQETYLGGGD